MSDELPIAPVPESTWLRVLAHALDPDAEASDASLVPDDDASAVDAEGAGGGDDDPDAEPERDADPWGDVDGGLDGGAFVEDEAADDAYSVALPEDSDDGHDASDDAEW